jgi:hypothetical protein
MTSLALKYITHQGKHKGNFRNVSLPCMLLSLVTCWFGRSKRRLCAILRENAYWLSLRDTYRRKFW